VAFNAQDYFALKREKNKPLSRESIKVPKLELGADDKLDHQVAQKIVNVSALIITYY
jgi:hypothetical protein